MGKKSLNNRSNHRHSLDLSENLSHIVCSTQLGGTRDLTECTCKQGNFKMDQQSGTNAPPAPHQVIYIIQAPKEKVNIKDAYNIKAATALGLIALGSDIAGIVNGNMSFATGIWTSVFFFISGGLAIGGARSGNKCLVVATMVMAIISAVSAGILLIMSSISLSVFNSYSYRYRDYYGLSHASDKTCKPTLQH